MGRRGEKWGGEERSRNGNVMTFLYKLHCSSTLHCYAAVHSGCGGQLN